MNLKKRLAVIGTAMLLTAALAVPASAHHGGSGHGYGVVAAANVLGETAQTVAGQAKNSGACVGAMMANLGKLEEYKAERLRLKQEQLQAQVDNGQRTQESADQVLENMRERQANCDGTGNGWGYCDGSYHDGGVCDGTCVNGGNCDGSGSGWGNGNCDGSGQGSGNGACDGSGQGRGNGRHNGGGNHGW